MVEYITIAITIGTAVVTSAIAIAQKVKLARWCSSANDSADKLTILEGVHNLLKETHTIITDKLPQLMIDAEKLGMSGEAKKAFVKSQMILICKATGIEYDDATIDASIESIIKASKVINTTTINR